MPQVPTYNSPEVAQAPLPSPRVSDQAPLEAFGGGQSLDRVAQAAHGLTQAGFDIYDQEKQKADQVAVLDAHNKAQSLAQDLAYNPQHGFMTKSGKDALGSTDYVDAKWKDGISNITQGLNNDAQKISFGHLSGSIYNALNEQVQEHIVAQTKVYDKEVTDSSIANAQHSVSLNPSQKNSNVQIQTQKAALTLYAQRNGWPPEQLKEQIDNAASDTHVTAINRLLDDKKPFQALAYYNTNKGQILGKEYDRITKQIDEETLVAKAQSNAAGFMAGALNSNNGGISYDSAKITKQIEDITDKGLRDETRRQVDMRFRAQEDSIDKNEASGAGLLANGQLTQTWLEQNKDKISDGFYRAAQHAVNNIGNPTASEAVKNNTVTRLIQQWGDAQTGDVFSRTQKTLQLRRDAITDVDKLDPEDFKKIVSWTDPNFVQAPEKVGHIQAALNWIKDQASRVGADAAPALMRFMGTAGNPGTKPEDVPALAQNSIRGTVYQKNPSLVGKADLTNNVVNQKSGPREASTTTSKLKPDQTLNAPTVQFKPGDEQKKNGIVYVRQADGKWLPKNKP